MLCPVPSEQKFAGRGFYSTKSRQEDKVAFFAPKNVDEPMLFRNKSTRRCAVASSAHGCVRSASECATMYDDAVGNFRALIGGPIRGREQT